MKLTPWFPWHVTPARIGVYQRDWRTQPSEIIAYAFWDGSKWGYSMQESPKKAMEVSKYETDTPDLPWRGLAHPPKKGK